MNKTKINAVIIIGTLIILAGLFLVFKSQMPYMHETAYVVGIITKDDMGLKPDVWYVFYDNNGKTLSKELDISNSPNPNLQKGMKVSLEGAEKNNILKVSVLKILNNYKDDLIWVQNPLPNQAVNSPLLVNGQARGSWYFEAGFPVKILDGNGKVLAQTPAQAQGNWMTVGYVPFLAKLDFSKPSTQNGMLLLEKDNPSGLSQNADELQIPIKFY